MIKVYSVVNVLKGITFCRSLSLNNIIITFITVINVHDMCDVTHGYIYSFSSRYCSLNFTLFACYTLMATSLSLCKFHYNYIYIYFSRGSGYRFRKVKKKGEDKKAEERKNNIRGENFAGGDGTRPPSVSKETHLKADEGRSERVAQIAFSRERTREAT